MNIFLFLVYSLLMFNLIKIPLLGVSALYMTMFLFIYRLKESFLRIVILIILYFGVLALLSMFNLVPVMHERIPKLPLYLALSTILSSFILSKSSFHNLASIRGAIYTSFLLLVLSYPFRYLQVLFWF